MKSIEIITIEAIELLKQLIETPSFSSEEENTAVLIEAWFLENRIPFKRKNNNIWAYNLYSDPSKPTLLLNSHHDTVKPNEGYTIDPFSAIVEGDQLFGLGSNDAGGCLVSLLAAFTHLYELEDLSHNIVIVASAEEESSGENGLNSVLQFLPEIDCAIVGEPTQMQLAIAEKGLVVLDIQVLGIASHAAHENFDNPIMNTISILNWFKNYKFDKISEILGPVKATVTQINAGEQHNVVPSECNLVVDVRVNEKYTNHEIVAIVEQNIEAVVKPRSLNLKSSSISQNHPLVQAGIALGRATYGSPTLSDQSVLNCQSLKLGPGNSTRSHTSNEFIYLSEIKEGIDLYVKIIHAFLKKKE